jgi:hypothetical protein
MCACTCAPLKGSVDLHVAFLHHVAVDWKNLLSPFSRSNWIGQNLKDRNGDLNKEQVEFPWSFQTFLRKNHISELRNLHPSLQGRNHRSSGGIVLSTTASPNICYK